MIGNNVYGGGSEGSSVYNEWQPHPDWWDIETILKQRNSKNGIQNLGFIIMSWF